MAYKYPELPKELYWDDLEEDIRTLMVEYDKNLRKWHNKKNRAAAQRCRKACLALMKLLHKKRRVLLCAMIEEGHRAHQVWVKNEKYNAELYHEDEWDVAKRKQDLAKKGLLNA